MNIRIINRSKNDLPAYETIHSAGMDLRADLDNTVTLKPMERKLIPTGLYMELPEGHEAQIRPVGISLRSIGFKVAVSSRSARRSIPAE